MSNHQHSHHQREYDDGLEVVPPPHDLEPVHIPQGLEVALSPDPEWNGTDEAGEGGGSRKDKEVHDDVPPDIPPRPWWKKKRFMTGIAAVVVIAAALGAGLGIGLGKKGSAAEEDGDPARDTGDVQNDTCGSTICPLTLATSLHGTSLYVIARASNDSLAYVLLDKDFRWRDWVNLGTPGVNTSFISQPRALNWGAREDDRSLFTRLDVFAVGSDNAVYNRWRSPDEEWEDNTEWVNIGDNAASHVSPCSPLNSEINLWSTAVDTHNITHSWWIQKSQDDISQEGLDGITAEQGQYRDIGGRRWRDELEVASSAVHCISRRETDAFYDLAYYANSSKQATVASYTRSRREWSDLALADGDWVGDPYLYDPENEDEDRWDFFGVQTDKAVYHQSWTPRGLSSLDRLGGSIISQPTVVTLSGGTYDVVALGDSGTLQHLHFDGTAWAKSWEDLGIEARSAPTMRLHNGQVVLLSIAQNGSLLSWTRDETVERSWKGSLTADNLGGDLSLGFYGDDS